MSNGNKFKIYCSHPIRGKLGDNATLEDQWKWIRVMRGQSRKLQMNFPEVDWYVPADHDEFVQIAYGLGILDVDQILKVDGEIIKTCDAIVYFDLEGEFSQGMLYEKNIADELKLRNKTIRQPSERDAKITQLLEKMKNVRMIAERDRKKAEMQGIIENGTPEQKAAAETVVGNDSDITNE